MFSWRGVRVTVADARRRQIVRGLRETRDDGGLVGRTHLAESFDLPTLDLWRGVRGERFRSHIEIIG